MASAVESMVVDDKQIPDKPVDREKVRFLEETWGYIFSNLQRLISILTHLLDENI